VFSLGSFSLLLDASNVHSAMTLGFESRDCDADFHTVVAKGAIAIESPADWLAFAADRQASNPRQDRHFSQPGIEGVKLGALPARLNPPPAWP
jgi:hypothetical protein